MIKVNDSKPAAHRHSRRALLAVACATTVSAGLASTGSFSRPIDVTGIAVALGMQGWSIRQVAVKMVQEIGLVESKRELNALRQRLSATALDTRQLLDTVRMWIRDDFARERLVVVQEVRFSRTEVGLLAALLD